MFFIIGQIAAFVCNRTLEGNLARSRGLWNFLIVEMILTFFLLSAFVKMIFYDYKGEMAQRTFDVLLILAAIK